LRGMPALHMKSRLERWMPAAIRRYFGLS